MRLRHAAFAATVALAIAPISGSAFAEPKTNMLHQWASGSDAAAIAKLGEMFTAAGGKWEQTSIAGHTANTLAKLRADVIAGNAPPAVQLKGPEIAEWNATGMTADLDACRHRGGLGEGRGARIAAGDEADRQMGRRADEHPPHQLDLGIDQGHAEGRHHRIAEDLGRVQRRLRQGGRREADLPRPFQRRLDRRDDLRSRRSTARISTSTARPSSKATSRRLRSPGMVKAFDAVSPDDVQVYGSGDRRARLRHRLQHDGQGRGRVPHHGRLGDRHADRRRLQAGDRLCLRARRRPIGANPASSSTPTRSCSSSRRTRTTSTARSCSPT